jgi:predicted DCC family thiol-disulfide oxidoreductase YuxK
MIVVFDAKCLLCSGWVRFLLRRRGGKHIQFASMQGDTGSRRYRIFGRSESCMLPPAGAAGRFLD